LANRQSLLQLGLGTGSSFQQPILGTSGQLSGTLRGLQPITTRGQTTSLAPNPFLSSFQTSLGGTLGGARLGGA